MDYCPYCKSSVLNGGYFCQNCGKKIREAPLSSSFSQQMKLYLISFFIPPVGLFKGYPYLSQKNPKLRIVGIIAVMLTIISIAVIIMTIFQVINLYDQTIKSLENLNF